jgi:glycosyltransferase involved in cell wall biosynthesis
MKIYLANIDHWTLPERAWRVMTQRSHQVAGNWSALPYRENLHEFAPDVIVYAPHRQKKALSWRDAALTLSPQLVRDVPTILWALYPDYLTGWDHVRNEHDSGFLDPVRQILPYVRATLTNSRFSKELLEARAPDFTFEVCYLCIDTKAIDETRDKGQRNRLSRSVLWQHRWATDKNFQGALEILLELAPRHPDVTFYLGRKENWDEAFWAPHWLKDLYAFRARELEHLPNVRYSPYFETQQEYWNFLAGIDIAFSCSYHETFGIAMLEQAYAGAACVVPDRVAYPEVHAGTLVVSPAEVERGIETLLRKPDRCAQVASSSKANAAQYSVERTEKRLLSFVEQVGKDALR